jgi:hypothetical protein
MVLVLALIVVAASLSFPLVQSMLADHHLRAASDLVRSRWADMRSRATEEGRAYRFAVRENMGSYRIAPDDTAFWEGGGAGGAAWVLEEDLPHEVFFCFSEEATRGSGPPTPGQGWTGTIVLQADGTAVEDVQIMLGKVGLAPVVLRMRALTGAATVVELEERR